MSRFSVFPLFSGCFSVRDFPLLIQARHSSGKIHHKSRQARKPPGVKRLEGEYVRRGDILAIQSVLKFHPGLNVDMDNYWHRHHPNVIPYTSLKALRDGVVVITCEKINPTSDNTLAMKYYEDMHEPEVYKKYFNVIPFKQSTKFNLVDLV